MALDLLSKSVFAGEFPLTAEFRSGPRNDMPSYERWKDRQKLPEGYPVDLQTNALRFSPKNYEYANRFAAENPSMLILSTWRAASGLPKGETGPGDPLENSPISFPGHFVVSPGSTLTSDISATSEVMTVESNAGMVEGPAVLVEVAASGEKLWERYEYVLIIEVNGSQLTIERQFNGSPEARAFPGGTFVAPMPWDHRSRDDYTNFFFNLSEFCPKDPQGRTAMDVIFEDMLYPLAVGGPLENLGGLDLASGPLTNIPENADYDWDGLVDDGSVYTDGVRFFYSKVREVLGPNRVITTSPDYEMIGFINGINQEGLANPDDSWKEVGRTVNDMLAWQRLSPLPVASIIFSQYYDKEDEPIRFQLQRLLNGYAVCLGMAADIEVSGAGEVMDATQRIELYKGDEREAHWLGRPLRVQRPASMTPNLLGGVGQSDWEEILPSLSILRGTLSIDGDELVLRPWEKDFPGYVTLDLNFDFSPSVFDPMPMDAADFTVFMEARSDDDQLFRKIFLPRVSVPVETGPVRAGLSNSTYLPVSFYVRGAENGQIMVDFRFDAGGPIRFRKLSVHRAPDTLACEFERGVVLVNPSLEETSFDLTELFEREGYTRLMATAPEVDIPTEYRSQFQQAYEINNGRPLDDPGHVTVGQRNALFLKANDVTPPSPTATPAPVPATSTPVAAPITTLPTTSPTAATAVPVPATDAPVAAPITTFPSTSPTSSFELCLAQCEAAGGEPTLTDHPDLFEIKEDVWANCAWVLKRNSSRRCYKVTVDGKVVKDLCPVSCFGE